MKLTYPMLIIVIIITVLITYGVVHYLDGVTITFIKKAEYNQLNEKVNQLQLRLAQLEKNFNELVRVYSNLDRILKEKKVIP